MGNSNYDFSPRIRSYLQRPVSETDQYVEDISIPSMADEEKSQFMRQLLPERQMEQLPEYKEVLIDKKVDPDVYIVGPGDVLSVYLWGELDKEFPAKVSPEGLVILPTVGPVQVAEMTLRESQARILESVRKKYQGIEVTVYLVEPRQFRVYISGVIENPGMYNAHSLLRVSDLLGEVVEVSPDQTQTEIRMSSRTAYERARGGLYKRSDFMTRGEKKGSSKRSIVITRGDRTITVDLLKFEKLGEMDFNPYVAGGDHIYVPQYQGDLYVNGEVNDGGIYEFNEGDTIADLIRFGGGLTAVADTSNATLVRFSQDGHELINIAVNLYDAVFNDPKNPEYLLQESDRLFVQTKYNYKVLANVMIEGQVKFPGEYAIIPHVTKISDVINLSGGFTDQSNLEEARIIRQVTSSMRDLEYLRLQRMLVADMTDEEYEYFKHRSRVQEGTISMDFVKLFQNNDTSYDIVLEDGDQVFVPMKRELINVLGAVQAPGYVRAKDGEDVNYYVNLVGGYNWNAKKRSIRIIKARTGQRLRPGKNIAIEGGDTIHVPEKKPIDYWQGFLDGTQLFANMATLIIIARNLTE